MSRWPGRLITKTPVTPGGTSPTASAPGIWTLPEMAYWKKQGLWPDASADAYWGYVSYLMATSSLSNASNNLFVDSSGAFNPVIRSGNTTQGAVTPYGPLWSTYLDGSSYLSAPASTAFAFGTGDFTVECWVNFMPSSAGGRITNRAPGGGASGTWGFNFSPTTFGFTEVVAGEPGVNASGLPNMTNTWVHLAACRSGSTLRLFANGVLVGSGSNTTDFNNSTYGLGIGASYETAITGYMSNVRIVKGTALYTAAFTPPLNPLTAVSGTSILTYQSNRFRDASSNGFSLTATGTPKVVPSSPFILNAPGAVYNQSDISYWSGYFNGSANSLSATLANFAFGTGAWTVEFWVYPLAYGGSVCGAQLFGTTNGSQSGYSINLGQDVNSFRLISNASGTWADDLSAGSGNGPPLNAWSHMVVVRSGANISIYKNGTRVATTASAASWSFSGTTGIIGRFNDGTNVRDLNAYVSNLRVTNTAVYDPTQSSITVPTAPLTAVSGTSLLTLQNAAFTDNSTNNLIITASGNATVTGNNPYQSGYYGNYFDGSGDYLTAPTNAVFGYGTGDFTIEFWMYLTGTADQTILSNLTSASSTNPHIYYSAGTIRYYTASADRITSGTIALNQWYHVALSRASGSTKMFVNGVQAGSTYADSNNYGSTAPLGLATYWSGGSPVTTNTFTGYLSNVRIVKGTAVYTAAFTPPTAPLTAISGTSVLTCQANRLIDSSTNALTLTKAGDTSVVPFDPFYTATMASNGGSMYFDGDGDYLSLPVGVLPVLGNFTTETWFYRTSSANGILVYLRGGTGSYAGLRIGVSSGGVYLLMTTSDGTWIINSGVIGTAPVGTWNHVAVVRNSGTITMYLNGTSIYSTTAIAATSALMAGSVSEVGRMIYSGQPSDFFPGYMSDVRITTGTVLYTGTFTPPTAPLTPSGNTTLLLNGMNAGEYDATMQNNFETIGNAQASSVQAKYGPTSAYFSGAVDNYLTAPNSPTFQFGTNDLTIEAWIYLTGDAITDPDGNRQGAICSGIGATGVSNDFWFIVKGNTTTTGTGLIFQVFNGGTGTVIFNTAYSFSKTTWYHVAFTRSGNNVYLFVNGSLIASTTYSGTITAGTNPLRVGYGQTGSINYRLPFPGYIDDLRITKGVARYTASFTPPTAALPVY